MAHLQFARRAAQPVVPSLFAAQALRPAGRPSRDLPMVEVVVRSRSMLDDDASGTPGWYESSWELKCGLDVREGLPLDLVDLPADLWLAAA